METSSPTRMTTGSLPYTSGPLQHLGPNLHRVPHLCQICSPGTRHAITPTLCLSAMISHARIRGHIDLDGAIQVILMLGYRPLGNVAAHSLSFQKKNPSREQTNPPRLANATRHQHHSPLLSVSPQVSWSSLKHGSVLLKTHAADHNQRSAERAL